MLCRVLMERLPAHVDTILLSNPSLAREEILYAIADELKIEVGNERPALLLRVLQDRLIKLYGEDRRVVVLIDEAHAMPQETLEQIRLLSTSSQPLELLQIVLFSQPELDAHLSLAPAPVERITHSFRLEPLLPPMRSLSRLSHARGRLPRPGVFARAVRRIVGPRRAGTARHILADKSLLAAFADNEHGITARHVNRAIRDSEFYHAPISKTKIGLVAGGVAAGLVLGLGARYLLPPSVPTPAAAALGAAPQSAALAPPAPAPVTEPPRTEPPSAAIAPVQTRTTPARRLRPVHRLFRRHRRRPPGPRRVRRTMCRRRHPPAISRERASPPPRNG